MGKLDYIFNTARLASRLLSFSLPLFPRRGLWFPGVDGGADPKIGIFKH